ncbi:hypothetical protein [Sulfuricaulis sp.]|jgi:membrane-bound metal-dependent hydrolase YbcI (DUF457 family)|uniref:hypothetical protein n=1 Tax=Sulfuricaulis sp. TaxID=2003553 RepID=UPI00355A574A
MFVGHYGVSFAAKKVEPSIPLWALFLAVQFLDVLWAPFVLFGIEKVRIVPGITATNPLDLYYMPYTHSLVAALFWSCAVGLVYQIVARPSRRQASVIIGLAVFSHWVLDLIVHRPDLPLYDNAAKVGLGLWNAPALAFGLEAALLFGGVWLCLRGRLARSFGTLVFGVLMLGIQAYVFFGPPPTSDRAIASTALIAYAAFAIVIWWLQDRRAITGVA